MSRREVTRLLVLFGSLYFVQGIVETTAFLPSQPLQTQLRGWTFTTTQVGYFFWFIGIAWSIKPLFGLISDFFPIAGRRRWPYLVLSTAATGAAFLAVAALWGTRPDALGGWLPGLFRWLSGIASDQPDVSRLGWLLLIAGTGVAMTDVVVDALAVQRGQPLKITGQIQSVQWGALSVAGLIIGSLGGFVAQHGLQQAMFVGCGLLSLASLAVVLLLVREPRNVAWPAESLRQAAKQLWSGRQLAALLATAAFLFLWNFNPFSNNVLQEYATKELHLSEQFYGHLTSIQAAAEIAACLAYFGYCRRVRLQWLVHGSIVAGIASTLCYWLLRDAWTAVAASVIFGLAYQTGLLIQLDVAARICPTESAGTLFATLMAISNLGLSAGVYLGGSWYERLAESLHSPHLAFHALVGIGAAFTAGCWLVVPVLKWAGTWK
jgi:BT1 family